MQDSTLTTGRPRRKRESRAGSTRLRTLILAVVTFVVAIPIIWALLLSLKTDTEYASADSSIFPAEPQWDNYREAVTSQVGIPFWDAARNSTVLSVSYSVLAVISSSLAGFAFARLPAPGRRVLFSIVIALLMVPSTVFIIPQFILFARLRLTGTYWPWILWGIAGSPFLIFMFRQFFAGFPRELEDAAEVDGAGIARFFFQILLPNAKPVLAVAFIFSFMWVWGDWFLPTIYLKPQITTLAVKMLTGYVNQQGYAMLTVQIAAAVVYTLPLIVMFFLAQKYILQGVVSSGLKG